MDRALVTVSCIALVLVAGCTGNRPGGENTAGIPELPVFTTPETGGNPGIASPTASVPPVSPPVTEMYPLLSLKSPRTVKAGENVTLNGTTILSPGQAILVEVVSSSFGPAPKTSNNTFYGSTGIVHVERGIRDSVNAWSYTFSTESFAPDTYLVTVSGMTVNVTATAKFQLVP